MINSGKILVRKELWICLSLVCIGFVLVHIGWVILFVQSITSGLPEPFTTRENDSSLAFFLCFADFRGSVGVLLFMVMR